MADSIATEVDRLMRRCLFTEEEVAAGEDYSAVKVEGIINTFGFHPGRMAESKPTIVALLKRIATDEFLTSGGCGYSTLNLCVDRNGEQWGGHPNMEQLCCLAIGAGVGKWCMPRALWRVLPGGMPYVVFDLEGANG